MPAPPAKHYDKWCRKNIPDLSNRVIVVTGANDEYRPFVETRVIETDSDALVFVINRGLYDYDLEIAVKGYEPVKAESRMYSVVKTRLRRAGAP